jgi:hypothetical protein
VFPSNDTKPVEPWLEHLGSHAARYLLGFFVLYAAFGMLTVGVYPSFSYPGGDEGTYLDYARHPWTLTSEFFEGFHPKEVQNPYNARLFLNPFSALFAVFGFTYVGARLLCFAYGMVIIWLVYRLGSMLSARCGGDGKAGRGIALLVAVVFSMQPQLLFFTHGIRPEIMFTLFLLLCTWVLLRREAGPSVLTWGVLGFLSSCMLLIHYNGVTCPPLFFAAALFYDRKALSGRKVLAFIGGGLAFVALFMLVNFLPALDTIREFGVMPVTFVSSSKIPIAQSFNLLDPILSAWQSYRHYWVSGTHFEPYTGYFTTLVLIPTVIAMWRGANRGTWSIALIIFLMMMLLVYVIPNRRHEYEFYLCPFFFVTSAIGLARLPAGKARTWLGLAFLTTLLAPYLWSNSREIQTFSKWRETNLVTEQALRRLVTNYGGGKQVTVMATQEFRAAVPDVRFRTFHSLIATRSLDKTFNKFDPDIVVLHRRSVDWIGWFSGVFQHIQPEKRRDTALEVTLRTLSQRGYKPQKLGQKLWDKSFLWDDSEVYIFTKKP